MKTWEIWSEGYIVTGSASGAQFHGTQEAPTFRAACQEFFKGDRYYNAERNTYWACKLFDNRHDAQRSYG